MRLILTSGLTLIEVLVSLLLLSLVLLGLDAMGVAALHFNLNAYYGSLAEQQMQNMASRLRLVQVGDDLEEQVRSWNRENKQILPQGRGEVSGAYPVYSLKLSWGAGKGEEHGGMRVEKMILPGGGA